MKIEETPHIMVLVKEDPHTLLFQFKSVLWGIITLSISAALGFATYLLSNRQDINWIVLVIFGLFSVLFLYSSIYSFRKHRSLEINESEQIARYNESSLYGTTSWKKKFNEFKSVKIFRPRATGSLRRARNWAIQLVINEEDTLNIGYNQFGAFNYASAKKLGDLISNMMHINIEDLRDD